MHRLRPESGTSGGLRILPGVRLVGVRRLAPKSLRAFDKGGLACIEGLTLHLFARTFAPVARRIGVELATTQWFRYS